MKNTLCYKNVDLACDHYYHCRRAAVTDTTKTKKKIRGKRRDESVAGEKFNNNFIYHVFIHLFMLS